MRSACRPTIPSARSPRKSVDKLLVVKTDEAYCQPCVSPVWDTALAAHALLEAGDGKAEASAERGLDWLEPAAGARGQRRLGLQAPAGGARRLGLPIRQPALSRSRRHRGHRHGHGARAAGRRDAALRRVDRPRAPMDRGATVAATAAGAAFDADNTHEFLNNIPFADHGALLDPPSPDLTARCLSMLAQLGATPDASEAMRRGIDYLRRTQLADGSWFGRWGVNYIYGTWSSLCALNAAGLPHDAPEMHAPPNGWPRSRTRTAAGARTGEATSSTITATSPARARPRRPPGPCSA